MIKIRRLTPALREKLKSPIGLLIQGTSDETMKKLGELVEKEKALVEMTVLFTTLKKKVNLE